MKRCANKVSLLLLTSCKILDCDIGDTFHILLSALLYIDDKFLIELLSPMFAIHRKNNSCNKINC